MSNIFKVGDILERIQFKQKHVTLGKLYEVVHYNKDLGYIGDDGYTHPLGTLTNWKLATLPPTVPTPKSPNNDNNNNSKSTYSFKTPWAMVNMDEVYNELSYEKPVAIIKDSASTGVLLIHKSIYTKANLCGIDIVFSLQKLMFDRTTIKEIALAMAFVKRVKRASYPRTHKPTNITVEVLSVD